VQLGLDLSKLEPRLTNTHGSQMNITWTEMILNTQNYRDCVSFYRDIFDLTVLFEKSGANFRPTRLTFSGS